MLLVLKRSLRSGRHIIEVSVPVVLTLFDMGAESKAVLFGIGEEWFEWGRESDLCFCVLFGGLCKSILRKSE
jgi:hypothetical protein